MKHFLALVLGFTLSLGAVAAAEMNVQWITRLEDAQKIAQADKKDLLVNFTGSDWCVWCIRLKKEVFVQPAFAAATKDFVLVELDYPRKNLQTDAEKKINAQLAKKYGIEGYPTILLMNAKGEVYAQTGYMSGGPEKYLQHLLELKKNNTEAGILKYQAEKNAR